MTVTKKFIKMCEKAVNVQEVWQPKQFDCYYAKLLKRNFILAELSSMNVIEKYIYNYIYLPTCEQSRKMSGLSWWKFDEECNIVRQCFLEDSLCEIDIETKEEAAICVVMRGYGKFWNGKDWVSQKEL